MLASFLGDQVKFIRWIFAILWPPFNMSLAFYDISRLSSSTIDSSQGVITPGVGFHWIGAAIVPDEALIELRVECRHICRHLAAELGHVRSIVHYCFVLLPHLGDAC